jgi:NAD(P)-dependent dehydrogenase (short-subunit alcohol dehydrogenase family)
MRFLIVGATGNAGQAIKAKLSAHQVHSTHFSKTQNTDSHFLDLTSEDSIVSFSHDLLKDHTPLTAIYFCHGLSSNTYFSESGDSVSSAKMMRQIFELHHMGPLLLLEVLRPILHNTRIVFVNSGGCEKNYPLSSHLLQSSHLTRALTLEMARDLGSTQSTVNMVGLGMMDKGISSKLSGPIHARFLRHSSLGRLGNFDELANFCHFLGTQNSYGTGQVFHFDGGL